MLYLTEYIGGSAVRECYVHPLDRNLCVKVVKHKADLSELTREISVAKLLAPYLKDYIVRYDDGLVETDKGLGLVCELVRNEDDGELALSLAQYQERFGAAEAAFQQELSWRQSRELLEEPAEVNVGERHGSGFLLKGPRFFRRFREFVPQLPQLSAVESAGSGGESRLFPELDEQLFQKQDRTGVTGRTGRFQK